MALESSSKAADPTADPLIVLTPLPSQSSELLSIAPPIGVVTPPEAIVVPLIVVKREFRPERPEPKHLPALDGIRGMAILLVILHHALHGWGPAQSLPERLVQRVLSHCWVGVDLFFVLSGFLITGILLDTRGRKNYLGSFYPRRMLRTFPLYYATIFVCFVLLPALPIPGIEGLRDLSTRQGWFWLHVSNFYNLSHNIVRMDGPQIGWMSTFWSLAVEEHFYLIWPLIVWCAPRRLPRICLGLLGGVLLLRIALTAQGCEFQYIYNNTFTRLDGMLLGSLVAGLHREEGGLRPYLRPFRILLGICVAGLGLVVAFDGRIPGLYPFCAQTIVFTFIAGAFASGMVLVLAAPARSRVRDFLSGRFLQACGKYSYAMYILNIPLILLFNQVVGTADRPLLGSRILGMSAAAIWGIAASLAAAWVTWNLLEKHCLKLKRYFVAS
jgi:peptidoglycan/LPS O-acetylase OafA/YrhL